MASTSDAGDVHEDPNLRAWARETLPTLMLPAPGSTLFAQSKASELAIQSRIRDQEARLRDLQVELIKQRTIISAVRRLPTELLCRILGLHLNWTCDSPWVYTGYTCKNAHRLAPGPSCCLQALARDCSQHTFLLDPSRDLCGEGVSKRIPLPSRESGRPIPKPSYRSLD